MAKYVEITDETQRVFDEIIGKTELERVVNFKIFSNNKMKKVSERPKKTNDLVKYMTNVDVTIVINEILFEQLDPEQQIMLVDEIIAGVVYNFETDRLSINEPDFMTHSGILKKYGSEKCLNLHEQLRLMVSQKDEKDAENGVTEESGF